LRGIPKLFLCYPPAGRLTPAGNGSHDSKNMKLRRCWSNLALQQAVSWTGSAPGTLTSFF
jgi:hypothetical protein